MEIKKISLNSAQGSKKAVDSTRQSGVEASFSGESSTKQQSQNMKKKRPLPKKLIVSGVILLILLILVGSVYIVLGNIVQWEDDSAGIGRKDELSVDVSNLPSPTTSDTTNSDTGTNTQAKGKITVTFLKDKGAPFDNGVVQLINSSGRQVNAIKTGPDGTSGVVVFGEVPAGSYTVVGGRENEIGVRSVSQQVSIDPGEFASVTLRLYIDTPVSITVTVTDSSGSPVAGRSLSLVRPRGDEGDEVIGVTTDGAGVFTASNIYPDDRWTLIDGGSDIARFTVAPTGQNQSINVKANSN